MKDVKPVGARRVEVLMESMSSLSSAINGDLPYDELKAIRGYSGE